MENVRGICIFVFTKTNTKMSIEKTGIYSITNLINGKKYIGKSLTIYRRWYQHRTALKANKHHSGYLQSSWNKHGKENFKFEVIEECDKEVLTEKEFYYIELHKTLYKEFGYNLKDDTKAVSIGEVKNTPTRRVFQIDNTNTIVKIWDSSRDVCEFLNIDMQKLHKQFYGTKKGKTMKSTFKGFAWVYEDKYDATINYFEKVSRKGRKFPENNKPIIVLNKNNEIVERFTTTEEGAKFFQQPLGAFSSRLSEGKMIEGLFVIRECNYDETINHFEKNPTSVKTIVNTLTGEIVNFTSYTEAAKKLDLNAKKLAYLIKGQINLKEGKIKKINSYKGWERF